MFFFFNGTAFDVYDDNDDHHHDYDDYDYYDYGSFPFCIYYFGIDGARQRQAAPSNYFFQKDALKEQQQERKIH